MFKNFHPITNLLYFILSLAAISVADSIIFFIAAFVILLIFNIILDRGQRLKSSFVFFIVIAVSIFILTPVMNPIGQVILFYLFRNPVTLESVILGAELSLSLMCVLVMFTAFNLIINQDKFLYLFSRFARQTAFVIMLAIRFVPALQRRIGEISQVSRISKPKSVRKKLENGMNTILTLITWSLEDAVITAQSMRSRGYGLKNKRAFYFIYKFKTRDFIFIFFNTALFAAFLIYANILFFICIIALPVFAEMINYVKWSLYDARNRV
jgi:energy-coupling factor transport system permease protein